MLTRGVYIKLVIFVLVTLVGVSYVAANYVGLTPNIFAADTGCTIYADFSDSGGIFTNAEVTNRGVSIGKVGSLKLVTLPSGAPGVKAALHIDNCKSPGIPVDSTATVSDRSVIGEQYINLIPANNKKPYMQGGETIPVSRTSIPVAAQVLLTNLDQLVNSVNTAKLTTVISELGKAFNNQGANLGSLLDSTKALLQSATEALPQTIELINESSTVLQTQLDEKDPLLSFSHSLNLLSQQLDKSNGDISHLLSAGPSDLQVIQNFVTDNKTDLGVVLADLASTGQVLVRHIDGLEEILELYPALVAGGESVIKPGNFAQLSLVVNPNDPQDCGDPSKGSEGYNDTTIRSPTDLRPEAPNVAARCTAPVSSGTNVRGSANVPGGDPISTSGVGGSLVLPRATTANTVNVNTSLNNAGVLADNSWVAILTASVS